MELDILKKITQPVFFVTNDVGRGIGLENVLPNYHIICLDDHPLVDVLEKSGASVFCLERVVGKKNILRRSSGLILEQPLVLSFIKEKAGNQIPNILFFKPQKKIEILAKKYGFRLIGNPVEINRIFEDKVEFFKTCQKRGIKTPAGEIIDLSLIDFKEKATKYGLPLVIQFGRGWAGNSTFFIKSENDLLALQQKYDRIKVKLCQYIKGITLLNNAVIYQNKIFVSKPAIQIKARECLTSAEGGTGGRSWPVKLTPAVTKQITDITLRVGEIMRAEKYLGFFGLDFLLNEEGEILLSENNARLTASAPFFTKLEQKVSSFPLLGYHLLSFFPEIFMEPFKYRSPDVSGSEITIRNTQNTPVEIIGELKTGMYDSCLNFKKESYYLESLEENDLWLEPAAQARIVNPEMELCKVDTLRKVCDEKGNLLPEYQSIVEKVRQELKIKQC